MNCVNISHPSFKILQERSNIPAFILASRISEYFTKNNTDLFPNLAELDMIYPLVGNEELYKKYNLLNDKGEIKQVTRGKQTTKWVETLNQSPNYSFRLRNTTKGLIIGITDKVEPKQTELFQLENNINSEVLPELQTAVNNYFEAIGVKLSAVDKIYFNGEEVDANAKANTLTKTVEYVEGKLQRDTLPEEAAHIWVDMAGGENNPMILKMMNDVADFKIYEQVVKDYSELYKGNDILLRKEAVGKVIASYMLNQFTGEPTLDELGKSWFEKLWMKIKSFFVGNKFKGASLDILKAKVGEYNQPSATAGEFLQLNEETKEEKNEFNEPLDPKDDIKTLVDKIKLFLEKKLAILKNKNITNKAEKEVQIKKVLSDIKALEGVDSINAFIEDAYEKIKQAETQFDSLIRNSEKFSRHEMIDKLSSFNDFANGYSILDEVSKEDIESFFNDFEKGIKEQGTFTIKDKLSYSILMRDRIKQRYLKRGIPLLADYLLEQKSTKIDEKANKEIDVLKKRITLIEQSNLKEKKKVDAIGKLEERINKLSGFSLDKESLVKELQLASQDENALDYLFSPLISSNDAVLGLFAKSVKAELEKARLQDIEFAKQADKAYTEYASGKSNINNPSKFNEGIYEEIETPVGKDSDGNTIFVKQLAFVQKYDISKFEKSKEAFFKEIGQRPILSETPTRAELTALKNWNKSVAKWFKENTQAKPQSEINIIIENKKADLKKGILTKEEYAEWENKVISEYNGEVTYKHELSEPSNKYINEKWKTLYSEDGVPISKKGEYHKFLLNSYLEDQEKLPESFRRGYLLPSIVKETNERLQSNGLVETAKTKANQSVFKQNYDTEYGIAGLTEKDAKYIPVFYTQRMDIKDISLDLLSSIMRFKAMTNRYTALNNINGEINLMKTVVSQRASIETNSKGQKIMDAFAKKMGYTEYIRKNGESYSQKHLDTFIDMVVYGEMQKSEEIFGIDAGKLTNTLLGYSAITTLAVDLLKATSNNIQGNIQVSIETAAKDVLDRKSLLKGKAFYHKSIPSFLSEFGSISPKQLPSQLVELYDAIQGEFKDNYGKNVSGNLAKKLFRTNTLFFNQHAAEHEIQVSFLFSALEFKKVKTNSGEEISLLQAYQTYGIDGVMENTDFTEAQRQEVMNSLHSLNKRMHGIYNEFDKGTAQRYSLGRLAIMYRKYLIPAYKKRYKKLSADQEGGNITEGYYRTFWNTFAQDLRAFKFNVMQNWSTYSDFEKQQIQRTLRELSFIIALTTVLIILRGAGDDDESLKESYAYNFLLYQATRMRSETASYISPLDAYRVVKSPSAMVSTIERGIKFTNQLLFVWDSDKLEFKRDTGVFKKGTNKSWAYFLKLIGISGYNFTPEEAVKSFEGTLNK